jgi:hypothetical protein
MYSPSQILISIGLLVSIIGSGILVWRAAKRFFISLVSTGAKTEIENEAVAVSFNRLAPKERAEQLADPIAQGFIATYKTSFAGFILLILGFFFQLLGTVMTVQVEANWAYVTPPWTFNVHDNYAGREFSSIPLKEWKQEAAFDSATHCERARLFAYKIRILPQGHREPLLGLFAGGAEMRANEEAEPLIRRYLELEDSHMKDPKLVAAARDINWKVIKLWEASKCVPLTSLRR